MLSITFMGEIRFVLDGTDITDQLSSKAAAIIALVLMKETRQMRRSDIISYLWSESSDDAAKYNLRFNLWQIKKTLQQEDGESLLLVSKDLVEVNPNFCFRCDITEIEQADPEAMDSIPELKRLLSLFRGDFFENCYLHNCESFLEYIILRRYYLENRKLVLYHRLIRLTYESRLYDDCLELISACEEIDPYNESIVKIRLGILIRRSAWRDAAKYYQMFYSRLVRDVGTEPSQDLQELSKQFHLQETKEARQSVLHLEVYTLPSLPGAWMSQVLKALHQSGQVNWGDCLTPQQLSDLSYFQPVLSSQSAAPVPMVRVAEAFMDLLCHLCTGKNARKLEITSLNGAALDSLSQDVVAVLQKKCGNKLVLL